MSVNQELDYYSLDDALARAQTSMDPSDCHGLLAGLICAAGFADPRLWLAEVFEDYDPKDKPQAEAFRLVQALYEDELPSDATRSRRASSSSGSNREKSMSGLFILASSSS